MECGWNGTSMVPSAADRGTFGSGSPLLRERRLLSNGLQWSRARRKDQCDQRVLSRGAVRCNPERATK